LVIPPFQPSVFLRAVANAGSTFFAWSGDLGGTDDGMPGGIEMFMLGTDKTVAAYFYKDTEAMYTLTSDVIGGGKIQWSLDGKTWADLPGSSLKVPQSLNSMELKAVEGTGAGFSYWFGDLFGNNPRKTLAVNGDKNFTAAFHNLLLKDGHTLSLGDINGEGTIWWSVRGNSPSQLTETGVVFLPGDDVILTALPGGEDPFAKWLGDLDGNKKHPATVTMSSPMTVGAEFSPSEHSPYWYVLPLLILLALLGVGSWWFYLFIIRRRRVNVTKIYAENSMIDGKDFAPRKKDYVFTISGQSAGEVRYRVGEEGEWRSLSADEDGVFTIPKEEIIDHLTIELK
jgi:hypothetical protein